MTDPRSLLCRRCGFANVPGDQFCGSCGAFLEWEGEHAADAGRGAGLDPDVPQVRALGDQPPGVAGGQGGAGGQGAAAGSGQGTAAWGGQGSGQGAATGGGPSPTQPVPGGALIRCPACGIANAAGRTFCQSCGSKLADAGAVSAVPEAQIVAAVNAGGRPAQVTTTSVPPARPTPPSTRSGGGGGGGGVLKWIAIMAVLGLVVGGGAVVAMNVLRGDGPVGEATSAPSTEPGLASPAPSDAPSPDPGATSVPTPTPTPKPKPEPLQLLGAAASSVVGDLAKFQPAMAIDGDPATCWQEGSTKENGEWIEVVFAPSKVTAVTIINGYNASKDLYQGNHRLKDIEIKVGDGTPMKVRLKDTGDPQKIDVKNESGAVVVRITILSVYKSVETSVTGTPFDDAALGEIIVLGVPGG